MKNAIQSKTEKFIKERLKQRRLHNLLTILAAIVVFCTTYALILPALTWEDQLVCTIEEHTHGDECYAVSESGERELICKKTEHTHVATCFDAPAAEVSPYDCGAVEHTHTEQCYFEDGSLRCTMAEHIHSEECNGFRTLISEPDAETGAVAVIEGRIPAQAKVNIEKVELSKKDIKGYFGELKAGMIKSTVAYDIKIMLDGKEWQPENKVSVTIENPAIKVKEDLNCGMAHINSETDKISDVKTEVTEEGWNFKAEGFSVYVLYTVDFTYGDYGYSMKGGSAVSLGKVLAELGIDIDQKNIEKVEFSNPKLVEVAEDGEGWQLVSLKSFDTAECLTITMKDGTKYEITVTDPVAEEEEKKEEEEKGSTEGIHLSKQADYDPETGNYMISLETYVEGEVIHTKVRKAADIVLLLDFSQSMSNKVGTGRNDPRRIDILSDTVQEFIDKVQKDSAEHEVSNKIGIAIFSTKDNKTKILQDLTTVTTAANATTLKNVVKNAVTNFNNNMGYGTYPDEGIQKVETMFSGDGDPTRQRAMVMFTDGEPGSSGSFEQSVANSAIKEAKNLKDKKIYVYSIAVISNPSTNAANYLQAVSSNYPNATGYTTQTRGTKVSDAYAQVATDFDQLAPMFEKMFEEITTGKAAYLLGETTVLKDIISKYFGLTTKDPLKTIKVYAAEYVSGKGADCVFGTPYLVYENGAPKTGFEGLTVNISKTTQEGVELDVIDVSGFDYAAHWCGEGCENGMKLIAKIPVQRSGVVSPDSGSEPPTNAPGSGIYPNGETDPLEEFPKPTAYPLYYLDIEKTSNVDTGDTAFEFTVSFTRSGDESLFDAAIFLAKTATNTGVDYTIVDHNKVTFKLKKGEIANLPIQVPDGVTVKATVTEKEYSEFSPESDLRDKNYEAAAFNADGSFTVTGDMHLTINNVADATLPSTGGIGTYIFYIAGTAIIAGAVIYWVIDRKRSHNL